MDIIYAWKMDQKDIHENTKILTMAFLGGRIVIYFFYIFFSFPKYILNILFMLAKAAKSTVF